MTCHDYEGVMSVLCTPLQVKCNPNILTFYKVFYTYAIEHIMLFVCFSMWSNGLLTFQCKLWLFNRYCRYSEACQCYNFFCGMWCRHFSIYCQHTVDVLAVLRMTWLSSGSPGNCCMICESLQHLTCSYSHFTGQGDLCTIPLMEPRLSEHAD